MNFGKGTVKKYTREYTRTLKNGKKKKYSTKQIQINVSKHDDIYSNGEEVLIIPETEIDEFKNYEETLISYEFFNYLLSQEINSLKENNSKNEDFQNHYDILASEYKNLQDEIYKLNQEINNLKENNSKNEDFQNHYDALTSDYNNLQDENYKLNQEITSLNRNFKILEKEYNQLALNYNDLIEKIEYLQIKIKRNSIINKRYKEYILNND